MCQITLSVVLITGAAIFARAVQSAASFDPGFDSENVTLVEIDLELGGYSAAAGRQFASGVLERIRQIPGVVGASAAAVLPTGGAMRLGFLSHVGEASAASHLDALWNAVEPGYFSTLGIPLLAGRDFDEDDRLERRSVIIVSETAARQYWPGREAIGQRLWLQSIERGRGAEAVEIVGVVGDVHLASRRASRPMVYLPLAQRRVMQMTLVVRGALGTTVTSAVRGAVSATDANLPILKLQTLEEAAAFALLPRRVAAWVSAVLGVVAVFLAAMGVYGVTAHMAARRLREFGIRIALGSTRPAVMVMVLKLGMTLVAAGTALGLIIASALGLGLAGALAGTPRPDAVALASTTVLVAIVGLAACFVPVRRVFGANPVDILRLD